MKNKYKIVKQEETGIVLSELVDPDKMKSLKKFQDYIKSKNYYSIREYNKKMYGMEATTTKKMKVQKKLCDIDPDYLQDNIDDVLFYLNDLKKTYKDDCWGEIHIDHFKNFWQGDYEGEEWNLVHEYEELDSDYKKRMKLIKDIEKENESLRKLKTKSKEDKDYKQYLKLKEKFQNKGEDNV